MNLLKVLYSKLYIEGFVNQPADLESAKKAIELLHNFAKAKNMSSELRSELNANEVGAEIIKMPHTKIRELTDVSKYAPILKAVYDSSVKINTDILIEKINVNYKKYAMKLGVMTKEQDLDDNISAEAANELLATIVKKPAVKEVAKEEPKKVIQEDENNIVNDNVIHHEEDINTNVNNAPTKEFEEFKNKLLEYAEYATRVENKDNTIKEMCNIIEGKKTFEAAFQNYLEFITKETGPFDVFDKMVPEYNDPKLEQEALGNVLAYFATIATNGLKDKELGDSIKALNDGKLTVKGVFKTVQGLLTPEQNTKFTETLSKGLTVVGMLTRMYQSLGNDYRVKIINNCTILPNNDKYVPTGDEFYQFYFGDNPSKFDEHPLTENVNKIIAANKDDAEYSSILNEANQYVVKATDRSITETYSIAESTAALSQQNGTIDAVEYVNSKAPDIPNISRADKSTFSLNTIYPPDDLGNFIKADRVGKIVLETANERMHLSKKDSDALKAIVKEIQDAKLFDFTHFSGEEGTKIYGLQAIDRAAAKITSAVNAEKPNKDEIKTAVAEYKETKKKIDGILKKLEAFNYTKAIPSNVSVARTSRMPGEYRANIIPVSRLNGLFVTMGLCNHYGIDINDFIDDPIKYQKELITVQFTKSKPATILENALNDIDEFDKFYSKDTNYGNIQAMISAWGITRPGELISTTFAEDKEFERAMVLTSNLGGTLAESGDVFKAIYQNKGATLANLMMYRKEDINLFKLCPVKLDRIDPNTFQFMKEPTPLKDYIKNNYTVEELAQKLIDANKYYRLMDEKASFKAAINELTEALKGLDYPEETMNLLNECLTEGPTPVLTGIYGYGPTKTDLDPNFLDFYEKYSKLTVEATGYVDQKADMSKRLEIMTIEPAAKLKHNFYSEKIIEHLKIQGINLNKLGYSIDTKGFDKFLGDYANDRLPKDVKVVFPKDLFDSLDNEASALYELRFKVPENLITSKEAAEKAKYIESKFVGIKEGFTENLKSTESLIEKQTNLLQSKAPLENLVNKDETYKPAVSINSETATYSPLDDNAHREDTRKMISELQISDATKNGLLQVINKMEEYGMFIGLDPKGGEQGTKVYGFKKYYDSYINLETALANNNLDEAYEIAKTCDQIKKEYHDVMDICKKVFPQDGKHCPGNISISRSTYCPIDFSARQQEMIQLNAVYQFVNACKAINYDVREAVNNTGKFMDSLLQGEKDRVINHYNKETKGETFYILMNGDITTQLTANRAVESLTSLECDSKLTEKCGLTMEIFSGYDSAGTNISHCFMKKNEDGEFVPDLDALKTYILGNGNQNIENYMGNNLDMTTGKLYTNSKTYNDIVNEDTRDFNTIFKETLDLITETTLEFAKKYQEKVDYPVEEMFAAASSVIQDALINKGLEMENTPIVAYAKQFIRNPYDIVVSNMKNINPEVASNIEEVVTKSQVTAALNNNGLFVSHAMETGTQFSNQVNNLKVDRIRELYENLKGPQNEVINPDNLSEMLLMARRLDDLHSSRGFFRRLFPAAGREMRLLNTIKAELANAKVDNELVNDIIYGNARNYDFKITFAEDQLRVNKALNTYSKANVTAKLEEILGDDTHHITPNQLTTVVEMCKNIKNAMGVMNNDALTELTNSFNYIQKTVETASVSIECQNKLINGEITAEDAILESAYNDNRIRHEVEYDEELNEDLEPMIDEEELANELGKERE